MDYPISFNNNRVYSVPDTRFVRHGFALERPTAISQPGCPITPVNMLPYQMATSGVPYGYALVPQQMLQQQQMMPMSQQMMSTPPGQRYQVPGGRGMYSFVDLDDEDDYVPPPPRPRSRIADDLDSPEMEEFSATTRQIRKDANAILQRLGTTRPTSKASNLFRNYDYDTKPLTSRYLAPPPDRSHLRPTSPSLDDEPDPVLQSLRPGRRSYSGTTSSRPILYSQHLLGASDRVYTPSSITANRIQSLYKELDEPLYAPEIKSFDYTECLRRDREAAKEKVRGDIIQRAALMEPSIGLMESREKRASVKRERLGYDPNSVKSNISIRAQYAAMRLAASGNSRRPASSEYRPSEYRPSVNLASSSSSKANGNANATANVTANATENATAKPIETAPASVSDE